MSPMTPVRTKCPDNDGLSPDFDGLSPDSNELSPEETEDLSTKSLDSGDTGGIFHYLLQRFVLVSNQY